MDQIEWQRKVIREEVNCMDCRHQQGCVGQCDENDVNGDPDFFPED